MSEQVTDVAPEATETPEITEEVVEETAEASQPEETQETKSESTESSSGDTEESIQDEIDSAETPAEEAAALQKMIKFKADGKEIEYDLTNQDHIQEMIKKIQLAEGAQGKMQEASEKMKAWEKYQKDLKEDPWSALEELGYDPVKLAEDRIQEFIDEEQKSPEQKEQEKMQAEVEALRKQLKEKEEQEKEVEMGRLQQEAEIELDKQITEALSSTSELPKTPYVVRRMADAMLFALENGYDNVTANDVLPIVQNEINEEIQAMFEAMPDSVMENYLGQKQLERLRKNRLKKSKQTKNINDVKETGKPAPKEINDIKKMTPQETREWLAKLGS